MERRVYNPWELWISTSSCLLWAVGGNNTASAITTPVYIPGTDVCEGNDSQGVQASLCSQRMQDGLGGLCFQLSHKQHNHHSFSPCVPDCRKEEGIVGGLKAPLISKPCTDWSLGFIQLPARRLLGTPPLWVTSASCHVANKGVCGRIGCFLQWPPSFKGLLLKKHQNHLGSF